MAEFKGIQFDILTSNEKNQLVSAGAGSGKTTIMIEKISNLIINDGVSVDNLLVVTFTVLAAQEMKDRLISKLGELLDTTDDKQKILDIIEKIKTASIDTIDGFASKTIKKYFYDLEISPNIEIISDTSRDYYMSIAMKKTIDSYSKNVDKINLILDLYGGGRRNLKSVEELILNNYFNIINIEDYDKFIADARNEYIDSIKSENIINNYICTKIQSVKNKIIYSYSSFQDNIKEKLDTILSLLNKFNINLSLKSNLQLLEVLEISTFSTKDYKENAGLKELNVKIKEIEDIRKKLDSLGINIDFDRKNEEIIRIFDIFVELLNYFIKNYISLKEKNNLIDFNDLNRLMLKLLNNDKIKNELQEKYKYIFLDEYQDVSPLQDAILSRVVGKDSKVFMVGDVKQSIYGFRGASPEWFLNKYDDFKKDNSKGVAFDMNVNFRSSPTILNFINDIFSVLMTKKDADIDYKADCMIEPKRDDIVDDKVKIMLVSESEKMIAEGLYSVRNDNNKQTTSTTMKEAILVLNIITNLIGTDFYDAKLNKMRKLTYKDIAILSRSEKDESARVLIDVLKSAYVPVKINNKMDTHDSEGIKLILSILKCIVGIADDVDYLSFFLSFTDLTIDDIVKFREVDKSLYENISALDDDMVHIGFEILDDMRRNSYVHTNKELIRYILDDKKLKYFILRLGEGEKELKLIEEFLAKLSNVEDSLNLIEFINVVESNVGSGADFETKDDDNSVTIQTIHKSKGLEYPVVILYNASKEFSFIREHDGINFNADIGFGFDHFDIANRVKTFSLTKYVIKLKNNEKGYKEELRLLYVALTRAKNKLFITGSYKPKDIENKTIGYDNYINCMLNCFIDRIDGDKCEFKNCIIEFIDEDLELCSGQDAEYLDMVEVGNEFEYPNNYKFAIPFKNTVTGINSRQSLDNGFSTKKWISKDIQYNAEDMATIGTHYHKALENIDYFIEYVKNTEFEDVDYSKIETAHSVISKLVQPNDKIRKEAEFMMYVPYNSIVDSEVEDRVLVQGVVDLIIEHEDNIDIVDYKFSNLPIRLLKQKYSEQLSLYKSAVEKAFKKKVNNTYIYSINTGELY